MKLIPNFLRRKSSHTEIYSTPDKISEVFGAWGGTEAGVSITPGNAMEIGTVFACVRILSQTIGMLPLNVMQHRGDQRVKAVDEKLYWLFQDGPNDFQTALEFKELVGAHLFLRGNHYSYINRVAGDVVELLPLNPACVTPKANSDWSVSYDVLFPDGTRRTLDESEIWHVRLFSVDGVTGLSPVQWGRHTLGLAKAAETHGSKLFANGARPSGGFETEQTLDKEQINLLKAQLEEYTGGGAHRSMVLQGGLKWFQTTLSNEDAQFLETRKFSRSEICALFGVPPHLVADLEKATFSNIDSQGLEFVIYSLNSHLSRIEQRVKKSLISKSKHKEYYAKFNVNALLRGDMKARAEFYTKMVQNGAMSPNEIRDLEDMNPRNGGDIYLTPSNMMIDGKLPAEDKSNVE